MCLAIPGKILKLEGNTALVDFDGIEQQVSVALIQEPKVGNYIIVHAGYAIEQMTETEALDALQQWKELSEELGMETEDIL